MNINKLKKEVHDILIKTDKYKCHECTTGYNTEKNKKTGYQEIVMCKTCNGEMIHADTSKLLMDIISQLVFALNALEDNDTIHARSLVINTLQVLTQEEYFKRDKKDTYEDNLSHAFLLLLDFAEYNSIEIDKDYLDAALDKTATLDKHILSVTGYLSLSENYKDKQDFIVPAISFIFSFCKQQNIDLEKHIQARLEYMRSE